MRQALALDEATATLASAPSETEDDAAEIKVELFGVWVKIRVK